jgi:hypothetical protein
MEYRKSSAREFLCASSWAVRSREHIEFKPSDCRRAGFQLTLLSPAAETPTNILLYYNQYNGPGSELGQVTVRFNFAETFPYNHEAVINMLETAMEESGPESSPRAPVK